jgi:hypothetical protein
MSRLALLFTSFLIGIPLALAQTNDTRRHELGHALSDEDYVLARSENMDASDARRVVELRLEAMRTRIAAIDAGLENVPRNERRQLVARGIAAPEDSADSHPQEVLDLVAAATSEGHSRSGARGVSERLRHKDRAIDAESTADLLELIEAVGNDTKKTRGNRQNDRVAMARIEVRVDSIEMAVAGVEKELRAARKRPGRLTF